jgi:hypothetical protein
MVAALLTVINSTHEFFILSNNMKRRLGFVASGRLSHVFWLILLTLILLGTILMLVRGHA